MAVLTVVFRAHWLTNCFVEVSHGDVVVWWVERRSDGYKVTGPFASALSRRGDKKVESGTPGRGASSRSTTGNEDRFRLLYD